MLHIVTQRRDRFLSVAFFGTNKRKQNINTKPAGSYRIPFPGELLIDQNSLLSYKLFHEDFLGSAGLKCFHPWAARAPSILTVNSNKLKLLSTCYLTGRVLSTFSPLIIPTRPVLLLLCPFCKWENGQSWLSGTAHFGGQRQIQNWNFAKSRGLDLWCPYTLRTTSQGLNSLSTGYTLRGTSSILSIYRRRGKFSDTCSSSLSTFLTVSNGLCCLHSLVPIQRHKIEFLLPSLIGNGMCVLGQLPLTWAESQFFLKNCYGPLYILTYLTPCNRCILGEDGFMHELPALQA